MRDLVMEIGCEEIPAAFLPDALVSLENLAMMALEEARLEFKKARALGTPRRLVLSCEDVAEQQGDLMVEVKGPPEKAAFDSNGAPTQAAEGFARSQGVSPKELMVRDLPQGRYVFARRWEKGKRAQEVLVDLLPSLVEQLEFPKSMRWGEGGFRFARPIRWVLALYGKETLRFSVAGLVSDNKTYGHRFTHPGPFKVGAASEYQELLKRRGVLVDHEERKARTRQGVDEAARLAGGRARVDPDLLSEVIFLVEEPRAFWGEFDPSFLDLPEEVLVTCMKRHQKYFPVEATDGCLLPRFVGVRNGGKEGFDLVRAGNERVLRARLADARFFFQEDVRRTLSERVQDLDQVTFHEFLGSMGDKARRLVALVERLGNMAGLDRNTLQNAKCAARLCKADLTTHMVVEFPELQGVMGRQYALRSGEDPRVAKAIFEHYLPRFSGDRLPATMEGALLAMADKADTIIGCFLAGIQPTGSSDPYGLRRQAQGMVLCLLGSGLRIPFEALMEAAVSGYGEAKRVPKAAKEFCYQRVRAVMAEEGFAHEAIEAVLAREVGILESTLGFARQLEEFLKGKGGDDLITAYRRSANLSQKAKSQEVDPALFQEPAEHELWEALQGAKVESEVSRVDGRWKEYLSRLASLRAPVDKFLDDVLVMAPDEKVRANRLALLKKVADLLGEMADLGRFPLEGTSGQKG